MFGDKPSTLVRRSTLMFPVNNRKFVEKSWQRDADAIILDLEDSIAASEKDNARTFVREAIAIAGRGGADVLVRINHEPERLVGDLEASIYPGLHGIAIPKVETGEELVYIEGVISRLEKERGIEPGTIKTTCAFESATGLINMVSSLKAATRAESMGVSTEDLSHDLGMQFTDPMMLFSPKYYGLVVARAFGLHARGSFGSISNYKDLDGMMAAAKEAYRYGFRGEACIHPTQVKVMNVAFSPDSEKVEHARDVVSAYLEGLERGTGSVSLNGKMIDKPVYERAVELLEIQDRIDAYQQKKERAVSEMSN